jgi:phospholipid-binding lipoprotein MlaA
MLPLYGPSTMRDTVGLTVDMLADPMYWALAEKVGNDAGWALFGLDLVTQIGQLKEAEESSIDFYSFLRSSYYQTRRAQLREAIGLPPEVLSPLESPAAAQVPVPPAKPVPVRKRVPPKS